MKDSFIDGVGAGCPDAEDRRENPLADKPATCSNTICAPDRAHGEEGLTREGAASARPAASGDSSRPSGQTDGAAREESLEGQGSAQERVVASGGPSVSPRQERVAASGGQSVSPGQERVAASATPSVPPEQTDCYLGIDIGSISTKGVIIDAERRIIARTYLWTEGNPADAARRVVADLGSQIDRNAVRVRAVGTTGSARRLVGAMCGAAVVKNEITAHAVGTTFLHPDVRTILEIGGQDSKIICVENGIAVDYAMNTLCAAGTGAFLSSQAHRLGVEVEEFGEIALTSKKPANIAARCTVFAESDLVHKIQVGYAREDIIAGLCRAVATNYLNNVGKGKQIVAPVVFQGGVSKNVGVVRAFEDELGMDVLVDADGHLMGAFGVALLAAEAAPAATRSVGVGGAAAGTGAGSASVAGGTAAAGGVSANVGGEPFDFDALRDFEFATREVECQKCANHCEIICVYRDGAIIDSWGNRCEKGAVKTAR
ncbi:MAG TPA: acyl-CoA dehydratase activase [Rubneribacter badeniensis]|uniref:Acyl-CoA dehydratase activase n=1 Tax=Rubneribacter badeniensis TaxID=2070688 RepID=A0A9D2VN11_9ACTN|nr:acyl-CoA dehydratase activase [Rubneribacter badeniensis]